MTVDKVLEEIEKLSVTERLQIVEELWDGIARSNAELPVPQWQKDELERRKQNFVRNPDSCQTWECVKTELLELRRKESGMPTQKRRDEGRA